MFLFYGSHPGAKRFVHSQRQESASPHNYGQGRGGRDAILSGDPKTKLMPVALTKIIACKLAASDGLANGVGVRCPRCEQTYRLGYSEEEWYRLRHWQKLAGKAIRKDHDLRHEAATIVLEWRGSGI